MSTIARSEPGLNPAIRLSVIIPARNEVRHLLASLQAAYDSLQRAGGGEILVVDGMSSDGTRAIAEEFARGHRGVRVLTNPARTTPTAFNTGIRAAAGSLIAIVSAHSVVGANFFEAGLRRIDGGQADIVGGPISAEPGSPGAMARLLALIVGHPFGVGNSRFRVSRLAGYVDAVPFAIYKAEVFRRLGLFHEVLERNQDTEFFGRVHAHRLKVFMDPAMNSVYLARPTLPALMRQGFLNAYWNVLVWRMTPRAFRWRHLVPGLFTSAIVVMAIAGFWAPHARTVLIGVLAIYGAASLVAALHILRQTRWLPSILLPPLFLTYHFAYGSGTIAGLRHLVRRPPQFRTGVAPRT